MQYQLKLKDGSIVTLRFSLYFLHKLCKLAGVGLTGVLDYVGGVADNLEIMAQIIAASMEAESVANRIPANYTAVDGFEVMEKMPNFLQSESVWLDIAKKIMECLIPEGLPKDDTPKKKAATKKLSSRTSSTQE